MAGMALAQNETDVLRYSQTFMKGSARFTAMGGAFGALGGDISSFMINPAGVGVYRSSEFTFSTGVFNSNQKIDYWGTRSFDGHTSVNVGNAGLVLNLFNKPNNEFKNFNIGIAYNRVNDFNQNSFFTGLNGKNSIMDVFAESTFGYKNKFFSIPDGVDDDYYLYKIRDDKGRYLPWNSILAYQTYLIDPNVKPDDSQDKIDNCEDYVPALLNGNDKVYQDQWNDVRGFNDVVNIAFGGNLMDVVYVGGSVNISNINYHSYKTYCERAHVDNVSDPKLARFEKLFMDEYYNAYGTGVSLGLGVILKPIQELRIGISYQSPTWMSMDEDYSVRMESVFSNVTAPRPSNTNYDTPLNLMDYRFSSPQKLTGSVGFIVGNYGILSADVEWSNYAGMRLHYRDDRFLENDVNAAIEDIYRNTLNARLGGELKLGKYAVRAGYQYYQNPYKKDFLNSDYATNIYSAGFGYRTRSFFLDFAYSLMTMKDSYSLYNYPVDRDGSIIFSGDATSNINRNSYILTLGFKF